MRGRVGNTSHSVPPTPARESRFDVPLVGRASDLHALKQVWDRARDGAGAFALVEGEGGSGKTRLVRELVGQIAPATLMLSAKAQSVERTPFGPLREAVDALVSRSLRALGAERERSLTAIRRAAGEFGALVRRLSPSLERVLGETADLRSLDPASEQLRFYDTIARFLANLAREHGPTFFLLDDVQWLDDGTLEVLKRVRETRRDRPTSHCNDVAETTSRARPPSPLSSAR